MKKSLPAIMLATISLSCQQHEKPVVIRDAQIKVDTSVIRKYLERSRKEKDDNYEILFNRDTLKIVSSMDYFHFPLGMHQNADDITKQVPGATLKSIRVAVAADSTNIIQITTPKSRMNLFYDDEAKLQEITSADINDDSFHLKNNIHVGMSKAQFLNIFFEKPPLIPVDIIKFIFAVNGINHYYYFKDGALSRIRIVTDYTFEPTDVN